MRFSNNFGFNCIGKAIDQDDLTAVEWLFNSLPDLEPLALSDILLYAIQQHRYEIALMLLPYVKSRLAKRRDNALIETSLFRIVLVSNKNGYPSIAEYAINIFSDIINIDDFLNNNYFRARMQVGL